MKNVTDIFINTTEQKILNFLAQNPGRNFFDKEVAQKTKISRGATNKALRNLTKARLIIKEKKGRMNFYQTDTSNVFIKEYKVLKNIIQLYPLLKKLELISEKIILYGSASRGENYPDSDIDLFVLTHHKKGVDDIIKKSKLKKLYPVVQTPTDLAALEEENHTFYQEIMRGVTLWENYG